jgi:hypothetical protein
LPAEAEYTQTYYLAMSGPEEAFTSLNDPANMRTVATTLHETLGLSDAYSPNNIKVWLALRDTVSPTSRHLLSATQRVMLAYALAKQAGLPETSALTAMVADSSMGTKLVQGLAAANLLPLQLVSQIVAISIVADSAELATTQFVASKGRFLAHMHLLLQIVLLPTTAGVPRTSAQLVRAHQLQLVISIKPCSLVCSGDHILRFQHHCGACLIKHTVLCCVGEMVSGPFFLSMASGTESGLPDLTNTTMLQMVAEGLHSAWNLPAAYPASNINVTLESQWTWESVNSESHVVLLKYSFKDNVLLTAQGLAALAADRSTMALTQVLTDLAFVPPVHDQGKVLARLSPARTPEDAIIAAS